MFNLVLDDSGSSLFSSKFSVLHSVVGEMLGDGTVLLTPPNHNSAMSLSIKVEVRY